MTGKPPQTSPPLPWKTWIATSLLSAITDASRRSNGTVNRLLLRLFDMKVPSNLSCVRGVKTSDHTVDASRNLWFRLFIPSSNGDHVNLPVIVFFHGGGFAFLSPDAKVYDVACRRFASRIPAIVISVNYRLSPEYKFPCQYDDGFDVLKFLDQNPEALPENADLSRCILAGDSAGGNLAHHLVMRAAEEEEEAAFRKVRIAGLIAIQPFFGGEERTEAEIRLEGAPVVSMRRTDWMWKAFLPEGLNRDHEAVNVSGPNAADISGVERFPKTLVVVGGYDPLQGWQRRYYEWLKRSGKEAYLVEYPTAIHAFYVFPELPDSSLLFGQVSDFIKDHCSSSAH